MHGNPLISDSKLVSSFKRDCGCRDELIQSSHYGMVVSSSAVSWFQASMSSRELSKKQA